MQIRAELRSFSVRICPKCSENSVPEGAPSFPPAGRRSFNFERTRFIKAHHRCRKMMFQTAGHRPRTQRARVYLSLKLSSLPNVLLKRDRFLRFLNNFIKAWIIVERIPDFVELK
jgi:hypothetical protein